MVLPKRLARFNKVATNRVTKLVAPRLPGFAMLTHTGRRSGRRYRIPLNVFRVGDDYVIALTYGPDADWVKNVLATGGCELRNRGEDVRLTDPRLVHDETRSAMPAPVRQVLALIGVSDFLHLSPA
ncbi:deazaflavin-dependent nitroreductase family protein [Saccharomonospora marina XMU15]|uniref:Deazaflavin-dependent nitroreductase family protein n=1 Tax=Saccharomonospora marina XMU15 TaxID=882083 RepID=H5WWL0_9PSEU|nr:nitroreductase family deazaflavin-dependent oxidoreductase [Saccharomonospora marina]EHR50566.1 deazaflavin-dependent nitroreductase family protein [Saccharomonospora marina XMU15]